MLVTAKKMNLVALIHAKRAICDASKRSAVVQNIACVFKFQEWEICSSKNLPSNSKQTSNALLPIPLNMRNKSIAYFEGTKHFFVSILLQFVPYFH